MVEPQKPSSQKPPEGYKPPPKAPDLPQAHRTDPNSTKIAEDPNKKSHSGTHTHDSPRNEQERRSQKDVDNERKGLSGNEGPGAGSWAREEGDVIGERPASIDFAGGYPWPNVGEPGDNRDDDDIIRPPTNWGLEIEETAAEGQRRKSDMDARARAQFAEQQLEDDPLEKDFPSNPASAFRTQREKDEQNKGKAA